MKARIENGVIVVYSQLPAIFKGISATYVGDFHLQSDLVHEENGFYPVVYPSHDPVTQRLGELYFFNNQFTCDVIDRTDLPTIEVAKAQKIAELKNAVKGLYQSIQWYLEMKRNAGEAIPQMVKDKITNIKTKYEQAKTVINGYTNVVDVLKWQVPHAQIETIKSDLESIN